MITLDKDQIKRLHKYLLDATGGLNGIRDEGKINYEQLIGLILEHLN